MSRGGESLRTACITVLGSGFAPFASGTWGSLVAVVLFAPLWFAVAGTGVPRMVVEAGLAAGIVVSSWMSVAWGPWAIVRWSRDDPKQFTLDEFAGQWVALLVLPIGCVIDWWGLACVIGGQFLLFRFFDIIKPPPARQAERLPAGWGILVDDLIAGVFANVVGQLLWRLTGLATWLGVGAISG